MGRGRSPSDGAVKGERCIANVRERAQLIADNLCRGVEVDVCTIQGPDVVAKIIFRRSKDACEPATSAAPQGCVTTYLSDGVVFKVIRA